MSGSVVQLIGLPDPGAVGDQDNLIMEVFGIISMAFALLQAELETERRGSHKG
jgi:hypothetical protein